MIEGKRNLALGYIKQFRIGIKGGKELTKHEREDYLNRLADYGITAEEHVALTSIMNDLELDW
ncbi:hypothetical protein ACH0BE_20110 [Bacillus subtilis]|uniref:hypothetical protein n=1 Tax=Bacillus subtilis TaxID=1423 RepID=UPI0038796F30